MNHRATNFLLSWNREFETTQRVLSRLPDDRWDWAPHPRSTPMGKLALHIVEMEFRVTKAMEQEHFGAGPAPLPDIRGRDALLEHAQRVHQEAASAIEGFSDEKMVREVPLVLQGQERMRLPVIAYLDTVMKSHVIHHRGQLTVYLRLLDVPVPSLYGPSADENPWLEEDAPQG